MLCVFSYAKINLFICLNKLIDKDAISKNPKLNITTQILSRIMRNIKYQYCVTQICIGVLGPARPLVVNSYATLSGDMASSTCITHTDLSLVESFTLK